MMTKILVNNGSDNGFLIDGTKPLPEPLFDTRLLGLIQCNFLESVQDMLTEIII